MNAALRNLLPLLSIGLNDETGGESGGGGEAGGEAAPPAGEEKPGSSGDGKGAPSKGDDAAAKAAAELAKSYDSWKPKLPEGMPFDEKGFGDYRKAFAEVGIKPEQAQKLVDVFANAELGRLKTVAEGLKTEQAGWQKTLKADEELAGKDGSKLEATMAAARKAMGKLATPEFRKLLDSSGLAAHPEMIRIMARAGAGMAEDTTKGTKAAGKGPELSERQKQKARYPNSSEMFND